MKKVLITGVAGNIGSSLAQALVEEEHYEVIGVDNLLSGSLNKLPRHKNFAFVKADVNSFKDISSIMLSQNFDIVFHYAAVVGVKRTLENPMSVLNDIEGIKNILELSKNTGVQRIFYSSSSEVYGEPVEFPQNEQTTPLNSRLPYAIVKNVGEAFLRSYYQEYGLNYTIFRFFNTYGINQSSDFVIPRFIELALSNKDITIYGEGNQTRTFCHISDNIEATVKCINENLYLNDTVNFGSDLEITIKELAHKIINVSGSKSKIIHLPPLKEGDMSRRKPDNEKMLKILNRPLISIDESLPSLIDYFRSIKN